MFVTCIVASWYQAEVMGKTILIAETFEVVYLCQQAHGNIEPNARNAQQQFVVGLVLVRGSEYSHAPCSFQQVLSDGLHLVDEQVQGKAC